jgi:hypothetical protein
VKDLRAPTPRPRARPTLTAPRWAVALLLAAVAADSGQARADAPLEPFDTATGQIAAQATDTMVGFVDRAMDVVWTGGDTLHLPPATARSPAWPASCRCSGWSMPARPPSTAPATTGWW